MNLKICIPLYENAGIDEIAKDFSDASKYGIYEESGVLIEKLSLIGLLSKYGIENFIPAMYNDGITMVITRSLNLGAYLKFIENNIVVFKAQSNNVMHELELIKLQQSIVFQEFHVTHTSGCSSCSSCSSDCSK